MQSRSRISNLPDWWGESSLGISPSPERLTVAATSRTKALSISLGSFSSCSCALLRIPESWGSEGGEIVDGFFLLLSFRRSSFFLSKFSLAFLDKFSWACVCMWSSVQSKSTFESSISGIISGINGSYSWTGGKHVKQSIQSWLGEELSEICKFKFHNNLLSTTFHISTGCGMCGGV